MTRQMDLPLENRHRDHHYGHEDAFDPQVTTQQQVTYNVQNETWFRNVWRPAMAWTYMAICLFDFIIAPVAISTMVTFYGSHLQQWTALTLQAGGLVHIAFGAILGIAAWGRTRERQVELGAPMYPPPGGGYPGAPYPMPYPPSRTVTTETTIVGAGQNRPLPPRPQRRE